MSNITLGAMDIFKFLPASNKTGPLAAKANCKKCGCPTCMMFALKLAKNQIGSEKCPCIPQELTEKLAQANKIQQKEVRVGERVYGGEKVMFRHEKTFINPTGLFVELDPAAPDFAGQFECAKNYEIELIGQKFTLDGVWVKGEIPKELGQFAHVEYKGSISQLVENLTRIRRKAIIERDENFSAPTVVTLNEKDPSKLCAIASAAVCKYASAIIFTHFNEAVISTLIALRQNIFTDPEKPLQVDSRVYEINNPDENAYVFLTTNFALTYFAVANELSALKRGSYLVVTPSEGMSVLTAWSAEKITAQIAKKIIDANAMLEKVKHKTIIIPGLLADLKEDLEAALHQGGWKIIVGTTEAYRLPEFLKTLDY